ncbi:hypothetical protein [Psychromonas sp. SA13A]|uniref:hypothetical protein n=1 Tax=Psychromonas sp. SA13A TaxID=2686346 RepID=UPI00140C6409|nr:hypothetical protein [Psychromonas sp. SA13A]
MNNAQQMNDDDLMIINNLLVKEIIKLKSQLTPDTPADILSIGENSLQDLLAMYKEHQGEIIKRKIK